MSAYFLRRLALVPITFLAITLMVYAVTRIVPGGPIEQAEAAARLAAMQGDGGGGSALGNEADLQLDEQGLAELERYYELDRPILVGYLQWLGLWPREQLVRVQTSTLEREADRFAPLLRLETRAAELAAERDAALEEVGWVAVGGRPHVPIDDDVLADALPSARLEEARELAGAGFGKRDELAELLASHDLAYAGGRYLRRVDAPAGDAEETAFAEAERVRSALALAAAKRAEIRERHGFEAHADGRVYRVERRLAGVLQLDLGRSYTRGEPVLQLIGSKMDVSIQLGLTGYLLTWLVCIPLGITKAIRHHSGFDAVSSVIVFTGYAMPGFVVCMLLLTGVAAHVDWLPLGGAVPEGIEHMGTVEAALGRLRHMLIPVAGYVVGNFATMTLLMKNSLLDNLAADYVRTAVAKGLTERRVVFVHALRNSLIPVTAGIGHAIGILFAGSFLIEKTCNIDGLGLLGYEAVLGRDYPIIMGTLVIGVVIQLLGNLLSDLAWALIDPRIRFSGERT